MSLAPRTMCVHPRQFGRDPDAKFRRADDKGRRYDENDLMAALLQHHIAIRIRRAIIANGQTQNEYAVEIEMSANRLTLILCGHQRMRLTDIAAACVGLDDNILDELRFSDAYTRSIER